MKDLRIEITDEATALYIAVDPDGVLAKTTQPDELVTIDWDAQGRVIGVEIIGSAAREAVGALAHAVLDHEPLDDPDGVRRGVEAILPVQIAH
jgi:YD repeat-containing protein